MIDRGQENLLSEWHSHYTTKGIQLHQTMPYLAEMNGMPARRIRVVMEHASPILFEAQLSIGFWVAAMSTANFLLNRFPIMSLENIMPFEAWYRKKPKLGFVHMFGHKAMVHTLKKVVPRLLRIVIPWNVFSLVFLTKKIFLNSKMSL